MWSLIEAAVVYYQATGKKKFLEVMRCFADLINLKFSDQPEKLKTYPGQQEIELALIKLYNVTEDDRYKDLASYFIGSPFALIWNRRKDLKRHLA